MNNRELLVGLIALIPQDVIIHDYKNNEEYTLAEAYNQLDDALKQADKASKEG